MQLVLSGDTVDLGDGLVPAQCLCYLGQCVRACLNLKVAGYGSADLLGIDNGGILFDDAPFFQRLDPHLDGHP